MLFPSAFVLGITSTVAKISRSKHVSQTERFFIIRDFRIHSHLDGADIFDIRDYPYVLSSVTNN